MEQTGFREIPIVERRLSNGLCVVVSEDHSVPIVAVSLYYDVGSRNEIPGRSGLAHLFEHMMFEGSANVPKTGHMRRISDAGGQVNATTGEERTNYFEALPSHHLEMALWLEADRMRALNITAENFENQRATVKEERRQSIDNQPYGEGWLRIRELSIANFAYRHPVIGYMEDLDRATLEEAREFFQIHYAPNNAVLVLVGDLDPSRAFDLANAHFGDIPAAEPPPPADAVEPPPTGEKRDRMTDPKVAFPALWAAYPVPPRRTADSYALELVENVLVHGHSSRLYRRLVKDEEAAVRIAAWSEANRGPSLFLVWAISKGPDNARSLALLDEEIGRLADGGLTEGELTKAKNILRADYLSEIQTALGRCLMIGEFALYDGDPNLINTELSRFLAVTPDQIADTVCRHLIPARRSLLEAFPPSGGAS